MSDSRCPKCQSNRVHRWKSGPVFGRLASKFTGYVPYRCATCGWKGWAPPRTHRLEQVAGREFEGPPPDLAAIDLALEAGSRAVR